MKQHTDEDLDFGCSRCDRVHILRCSFSWTVWDGVNVWLALICYAINDISKLDNLESEVDHTLNTVELELDNEFNAEEASNLTESLFESESIDEAIGLDAIIDNEDSFDEGSDLDDVIGDEGSADDSFDFDDSSDSSEGSDVDFDDDSDSHDGFDANVDSGDGV